MFLAILVFVAGRDTRTYVDGYPIGARRCTDPEAKGWLNAAGRPWCDTFANFARQSLDAAAPGHAQVSAVEFYDPDFGQILATRSGGSDLIAVLRLQDGGVRSFYVGCGIGAANDRCFVDPDYAKRRT